MATINYNSPEARVEANFQRDGKTICGDSNLIYVVDHEQAKTRTTSKTHRIEIKDLQTDTSILNQLRVRCQALLKDKPFLVMSFLLSYCSSHPHG